jgi:hypothetical protein
MELEAYRKFKSQKFMLPYKEWFYKNARTFTKVDEKISEKLSLQHDCQIKECYRNSWIATCGRPDLKYFEGFVASEEIPIPIEHSWIVNADGKVIDLTLIINGDRLGKQLKKNYGINEKSDRRSRLGDEYFGLQIPTDFVNKMCFKNKITGTFLFEYFMTLNLPKLVNN